jgi:hypothetical protein
MRGGPKNMRLIGLAALCALGACAPHRYANSVHPEYGLQAYEQDLDQCRAGASTQVVSSGLGYPTQAGPPAVSVMLANACMAKRGWETAPNPPY